MKKILLILIILVVFQQMSVAQKDSLANEIKHKMTISLAGGMTFPHWLNSSFEYDGNPNINQEGIIAGGPLNGYYGKLDFSYSFAKHFGIRALIYSSANKGYSLKKGDFPWTSSGMGGGLITSSFTHKIKDWQTSGALIGMFTEMNYKKFFLNFYLTGGVQQVKTPEAEIIETGSMWIFGSGTTGTYISKQIQPSMFSYNVVGNIGANLSYALSKKWKAGFGIDVFYSQPEFKGKQLYTSEKNYANGTRTYYESYGEHHFRNNYILLCINVGVSYAIR